MRGPLDIAQRLATQRGRALLHSGANHDECGERTIVACEPQRSIEAWGRRVIHRDHTGEVTQDRVGDYLAELQALITSGSHESGPWAIGYLGYDFGRQIERIGLGPQIGNDVADAWFGLYSAVWTHDHVTGQTRIIGDPDASQRLRESIQSPLATTPAPILSPLIADENVSTYNAQIARVLDYIHAGDVYQVNLARRLVARVVRPGDPLTIYRYLLRESPAAYGAVVEADGVTLISGSPERFLSGSIAQRRLETRPIKGTRSRASAPAELTNDDKERAEHLMIVDLERNDLGRVAELGTVRVDRFGYVVELPTLHHMVSRISCQLSPTVDLKQVIRATFPGGSITGAPKIRAMQIIDELEPARRGPYTGSIGLIDATGAFELSIAIRTAIIAGDELRLHVGGGIVADSTAKREFAETETKAAAWRRVLERFTAEP